ncbi:MAG: bifunctional transaldolase/phosoglucose isomerase [Candidatus Korobacteraceae bacterium]
MSSNPSVQAPAEEVMQNIVERHTAALGKYESDFGNCLQRLDQENFASRLWQKDPTLWKSEPEHEAIIAKSLGWLTAAETMQPNIAELNKFADEIRNAGFEFVVVLGMGGSSLGAEVLSRIFGKQDEYPQVYVLDSTVPTAVRHLEQKVNLGSTLFVVSSKSSTTTEPQMFQRYFHDRVKRIKGDAASQNFIAVTDPESPLTKEAAHNHFRRVWLNLPNIGGRYSALSYFGMLPFALMGGDVKVLLDRATQAAQACAHTIAAKDNPGLRLGAALSTLANAGRNKLTLITPQPLSSLGLWIEQLIAESLGKEGKGIVPVAGEPLGAPEVYGDDRVFVYIHTGSEEDGGVASKLSALEAAGHPVLRHKLRDPLDLGQEFFLWEFATAIAGALLGLDPFDQPDVQESKDNTKRLLAEYAQNGALPQQKLIIAEETLRVFGDPETCDTLRRGGSSLQAIVTAHLSRLSPGDYFAITAYIEELGNYDSLLQQIRGVVRDAKNVATTVGYGPRFLHSTGQLHKGGSDSGLFLQVTSEDINDIEVPGEKFSFGVLKHAQELGDFEALSSRHRRVVRIDLGRDVEKGLRRVLYLVKEAVTQSSAAVAGAQK